MNLSTRIFLAYFAILGIAIYMILNVFMSEIKPGVRQSTEDTLVDMSNLLAEIVTADLQQQHLQSGDFKLQIERFLARSYRAKIYAVEKFDSSLRIYITDAQGIVQFDSANLALGADYSQWNDVYLTLRGKYGARSTPITVDDPTTTVMHVAAPIVHQGDIIGVVTVAKTNLSLQPFINMARQKIETRGVILILLSIIAALILSYWLTASIRKLTKYADQVAAGEAVSPPPLGERELAKLAQSMDNMRQQLEGKEYVEKYVYALTHELKSPVSAIKGAAEIIDDQMPSADRNHFMANIRTEIERIDEMINKMLQLTKLEKCELLTQLAPVDPVELIEKVLASKALQLASKSIQIEKDFATVEKIEADNFLLTQALDNLVQNAVDFSDSGSVIKITIAQSDTLDITVKDWGAGIPSYALNKVFERFYSLPRPASTAKSSGLGLCFVQQICLLHRGEVELNNHHEGGVSACLRFNRK
ncbi:MAG: two-component system sensor histidine kinase CreC [Oceanospirillaceae bacterium]